MSQRMRLLALIISGLFLGSAYAEAIRTNFSVENRFPHWEQLELGASYKGYGADSDSLAPDLGTTSIYARYGILSNLAAVVDLPWQSLSSNTGGSDENGLGDMKIGFQLLTYEDIFGYPYFIPHASFTLPTGDQDKGLGQDGVAVEVGLAYGSTINDWIEWVWDIGYTVNPDIENQFKLSNSYVWVLSPEFALTTEIVYKDVVDGNDSTESQVLVSGGFSYLWNEKIQMDLSAGGGLTGPVDVFGEARISYSF
ncbi:transporter [Kiritimatiellota bacterium B12222]|nr:transporter [Kiritimatiellota bacterium B12222]